MRIEVMKQALEALESDNPDIQLRAAIALRQAIEQAEQAQPVEMVSVANTIDGFGVIKQRDMNFARAIEAMLKEKNT